MPQRPDKREPNQLRPVKITRGFTEFAPGSVLIEMGRTRVLCTAVLENGVPPFLYGKGHGWMSAEYSMLPSSTPGGRKQRERNGKTDGRGVEIQRLIGRALRAVTDITCLPEKTLWIDCDVLQADGGTRTAAITGSYIAMHDALSYLDRKREIRKWPLTGAIAAVSVGIVSGVPVLDINYDEDSKAEVDMNIVMTDKGEFVELQGSAEKKSFTAQQMESMIALGKSGIEQLLALQKQALAAPIGSAPTTPSAPLK